ncbi:MAG TPA: DUF2946 family protein [Telluria sp.]
MTTSRVSRQLICFVLLLYATALGVAMAGPFLHPKAMNLVCTSTGYKLVDQSSDAGPGADNGASHLLDCPLCLAGGIAPSFLRQDAARTPHALSYALRSIPSARLAWVVSAPLPARGPPAFS